MGETGKTQSQKNPNKVLARKGSKMVHGKVPLSRELITVIACGNPNEVMAKFKIPVQIPSFAHEFKHNLINHYLKYLIQEPSIVHKIPV